MADLILGPLLRYVGEAEATIWVETDAACEVEVLGHRASTFCVAGHHYALVVVRGLDPGQAYEYEVALDGQQHWPPPGWELPPSTIRTIDPERPVEIVFGSCRVAVPHEPPQNPTFDNQFATLTLDGRKARMKIEKIVPGDWRNPGINITLEKTLY